MYTESRLLGLYAETPVHPGSGSTTGVIDLPVQRERHTGFPMIQGTSVKGVLRDLAERGDSTRKGVSEVFGPPPEAGDHHAGALSLTDARLLAFPVRSLQDVFVWVTCPLVLDRLRADAAVSAPWLGLRDDLARPERGEAVRGTSDVLGRGPLVLEEYDFKWKDEPELRDTQDFVAKTVAEFLPGAAEYAPYATRVKTHLILVSDGDFQHLVSSATEVVTRIRLNKQKTTTGEGGNMWVEEFLPADCLFWALALASDARTDSPGRKAAEVIAYLKDVLSGGMIQIGADETVGRGWMRVRVCERPEEGA